jgi:hypothetical protein
MHTQLTTWKKNANIKNLPPPPHHFSNGPSLRRFKKLLGSMKIRLIKWSAPNVYYYMAFQNYAPF